MWYFAWILGLPLAAAFAVLNAMWFELMEDDAIRRDRRAPPLDLLAEEPLPPPGSDALIQSVEHAERVRAALAALPPEQAEVVRLSFFDDRPHGEIERALGIPLGTVKSRLRLAMMRLRAVLDDIR